MINSAGFRGTQDILPTFLFIGAEKAGTTWFYARLKEHPDIFVPETKELHFFNKYNSNLEKMDRFEKLGLNYYQRFFQRYAGEKAIGEVCPMYLCDPCAPVRIRQTLPQVKLIACLRNPADRAYSHYWMARGKKQVSLSFDEVVRRREPRFIKRGLYYGQIKRYYELFPIQSVLVLIYERVFSDPLFTLRTIGTFLGIDPIRFDQARLLRKSNMSSAPRSPFLYKLMLKMVRYLREQPSLGILVDAAKDIGLAGWIKDTNKKKVRYPPMGEHHRGELVRYYRSDIRRLERLIGHNLDMWK